MVGFITEEEEEEKARDIFLKIIICTMNPGNMQFCLRWFYNVHLRVTTAICIASTKNMENEYKTVDILVDRHGSRE